MVIAMRIISGIILIFLIYSLVFADDMPPTLIMVSVLIVYAFNLINWYMNRKQEKAE